MRDGRRERHRAPWHATCRGQRVSPLAPARPAAAHAGGAATSRGTHRRCAPRGDIRRLKNNDAATSITRGQVLALRIKLDRADQVLCAGGARRRVVAGPCNPCAAPPPCQCSGITPSAPLAPAKTDEQADNSNQGLRRTVCRLFCRVFLPKDLPESPVCVRHRWRCLHSKTSVFRAHGRQSTSRAATPAAYLELSGGDRPCSPLQHQRYAFLGAAAKFSVGHASFASFTFGEAECGTCII